MGKSWSLRYFYLKKILSLFHILHVYRRKPTEITDFMNIVLLSTPRLAPVVFVCFFFIDT